MGAIRKEEARQVLSPDSPREKGTPCRAIQMGSVFSRDGVSPESAGSGGVMTSLFRKLNWLLRRRSKEAELEEELQFHLDEETEERQAAGSSPEEAYRAARVELGNVTLLKEDTRSAWSWVRGEQLARDVRNAARIMRRNIQVNVVILCTIALGISANTAMFSIVNVMLLKLPIQNPERLV